MKHNLIFFALLCLAQTALGLDYFITNVRIEGQDYRFLVDNGCQITTLFKDRLRTEIKTEKTNFWLYNANNDSTQLLRSLDKISIKLLDFDLKYDYVMQPIVFEGKNPVSDFLEVDGILGYDVLSRHNWKLDYQTMTISLIKGFKPKKGGYFSLDLDAQNQLDFKIQKRSKAKAINTKIELDLGFSGYFSIWDETGFSADDLVSQARIYSALGYKEVTTHIEAVDLFGSGLMVANFPIDFNPEKSSNLMGNAFLKLFGEVYLIHKKRKVYLPIRAEHRLALAKIGLHKGIIERCSGPKGEVLEGSCTLGAARDWPLKEEEYWYFDVKFGNP